MRDHFDKVDRTQAAEHLALEHDRPAVLEHPDLATEFVLVRRRRLLVCVRVGVVDRALAPLHHQVGERQVVAEARVDLDIFLAPYGIDRAVAARDGVDA
jgi:hypothetical protein